MSEFVSLNGIMEAPSGEAGHPHSGWTFESIYGDGHHAYKRQEVDEAESLLLERVTYEGFSAAWPEREGPFADKINSMPKYVVSSTLPEPDWENTRVLEGDPIESVAQLKEANDGPILVNGSARLAHALAEVGLVDEYRGDGSPGPGRRRSMFSDPAEMQKLRAE